MDTAEDVLLLYLAETICHLSAVDPDRKINIIELVYKMHATHCPFRFIEHQN
jgi:hypothetical protein